MSIFGDGDGYFYHRRVRDPSGFDQTVAECASETGIDASLVEAVIEMHEAIQHKRERPQTPGRR